MAANRVEGATVGDNGNGDNGNGDKDTRPSWVWLTANWHVVSALAAATLGLSVVFFVMVGALGFPVLTPGENPTVESANIAVGSNLVRWGLAITLLAFIPALLLSFIGAFRVEQVQVEETQGFEGGGSVVVEVIKAVPDLLKVPGGFGIALALIGAIIMTGTALGDGAPDPTPSPAPTPTSSVSPAPDQSG